MLAREHWLTWAGLLLGAGALAGCGHWRQPPPIPLPFEVSDASVQARIGLPPGVSVNLNEAVLPPDDRPAAPPAAETDGPLAPALEVFALPDAIAFALRNSPRLRAARAAIDQAQADTQIAFAPFLPTVDFHYRAVGFLNEVQPTAEQIPAVVGFGSGTQAFTQGELQLQWTICDFGRTASRYGRAVSREQVAALRSERAGQTVAFDVVAAYLRVLFARAARRVQEQAIVRAEAILKDTRARRAGGVADRDDVLRAEVQLSETREGLALARQLEFDALARLNLVMGRPVSWPIRILDLEIRPGFARTLPECLETAAAQRREVEIARNLVAAAEYGVAAARAEFRPRIYTKGLIARVDGQGVESEDVQGVGLHFDQRLFAGFQRVGERSAAQAVVQETLANAQLVLDNIALEVNLAFREIATARERIRLSETSIVQARENLRLVTVKYRNGDATPTDVVDAETTLTRSQQRYYSAVYEQLTALARLDYAMGTPQGSLLGPHTGPETEDSPPREMLPPPRVVPE